MTPTTAYLLYSIFAIGGVGIYLLLPKAGKPQTLAGAVIGVLSVAGLLAVLAARVILPDATTAYFYLFATIAVLAAARVITHPKPVYCALYFVLVVIAVAALLVLQRAEFLAVALIMIYAGAILVTYLFVIMLAHQGGSPVYDRRSREPLLAVLAGFLLMAAVAGRAEDLPQPASPPTVAVPTADAQDAASQQRDSNTSAIGTAVMTKYVVALEIAGVLLLVAMVGAIAMSRKKVAVERFAAPPKPIGQAGREVEPY
ncbi:MAG: NADH-quinone oxidoreductase subunit J [Phycisphaerales bacterium]|nr:MAG: NADH-quinone oxidoreductase subunit J [Phycisphaerales bacterium]